MNLTQALGFTLLHFVWQGTLIAVVLAIALAVFRQARSPIRYVMSCTAMLLMFLSAAATFLNLGLAGPAPYRVVRVLTQLAPGAGDAAVTLAGATRTVGDYLPLLVWAWIAGVLALSIRSLGGWVLAQRFARLNTSRADAAWEERFIELTRRLSLSRPVRLAVSTLAEVPVVIGWLRPVVLVPAQMFVGLSPEQVEGLLAHELAHIRRHDYLVNLFQTAVETLLFYHPAVWWVGRTIRVEREHCCDDLAVEFCGNTLSYVRALTDLEEMRARRNVPGLAMAADAGSLLHRVQRLLRIGNRAPMGPSTWIVLLGMVASLSIVGVSVNAWAQRPEKAPEATVNAPQREAAKEAAPKTIWLDDIQAAGYREVNVDNLISMKIHGVTGEYIRQMRANGFELTADQLVEFRIHDVTANYISELKQSGLGPLTTDNLVELKIHAVEPAWVREIQSLGYPKVTVDEIVNLRIHDIKPDFIREAQRRLKNISVDQLVELKIHGILAPSDATTPFADVLKVMGDIERQVTEAARAVGTGRGKGREE